MTSTTTYRDRAGTLTVTRERRRYCTGSAWFLVAMHYAPAAPAGPQQCAARRGKSA